MFDESPRLHGLGTAAVGKRFWSHVKNIRRDSCGVATLNVGGVEISSSKGKSEALSNQYSSVSTTEDVSEIPTIEGDPFPTIENLVIDTEGVRKLLEEVKLLKACGPEGVSSHAHILKEMSQELAPIIRYIFAQLETGNIGGTPLIQLSIEKHAKPTLRDCNFTPHVTIF